jgi:hypothetical protein
MATNQAAETYPERFDTARNTAQYGADLPRRYFVKSLPGVFVEDQMANWTGLYLMAATETDVDKVPARIATARHAIARRLQELRIDGDDRAERQVIENVLRAMQVLESESRDWPRSRAS